MYCAIQILNCNGAVHPKCVCTGEWDAVKQTALLFRAEFGILTIITPLEVWEQQVLARLTASREAVLFIVPRGKAKTRWTAKVI